MSECQNIFESLIRYFTHAGIQFKYFPGDHSFEFETATEAQIAREAAKTFENWKYTPKILSGQTRANIGEETKFILTITCMRDGGGGIATLNELP